MNTTVPNLPPLSQTTELRCSCGCKLFDTKTMVRKVSRFLFNTALNQDVILPIPILTCSECGEILPDSVPVELRKADGTDNI